MEEQDETTDKTKRIMAQDGYVTRADALGKPSVSQIKERPAPPAPINLKQAPATITPPRPPLKKD